MRWKLFATLSETAGDTVIETSPASEEQTLRDAFDALLASHPELEAEVLDDDGELQEHIRLLCDGDDPFRTLDGWETALSDSEELALFPPVSGG